MGQQPARFAYAPIDRELCERIGARATPLRCMVLHLLEQADKPIGAYEVMARLDAASGRRHAPPTIYRALAFLLEQKLAIRIVSLNAYMAASFVVAEDTMLCICDRCGHTEQAQGADLHTIDQGAVALGFHVDTRIVELRGLCARCLITTAPPNI